MQINGIELAFDITAPADVLRYKTAGETMEVAAQAIALPPVDAEDSTFLDSYMDMLNAELRLFGNFLDEVFGDGVAAQLLGQNPSLRMVGEINEAFAVAMEAQGKEFGVQLKKYTPNRATRRKT